MSRPSAIKGPFSEIVWRVVRDNWGLFRKWCGEDMHDDQLIELLRRAGCLRSFTRRKHATARLQELRDMDAITLLGIVGRL